jgi:DNA-binding NarL/FixJ family response regulator
MKIKIGLVDDHQLFLKSLRLMLESIPDFEVVTEASDGLDLQKKLGASGELPDILLVDVDMPRMNGIQTAEWLKKNYPSIKPIALSMSDQEQTVIRMIKAGCRSFLLKDIHPVELEKALREVHTKNYYNSDLHEQQLSALLLGGSHENISLSEKEKEFLQHAASDNSYRHIAQLMNVSERSVDGYRESIFNKLKVQSRTGMVLEAIRRGWVKV